MSLGLCCDALTGLRDLITYFHWAVPNAIDGALTGLMPNQLYTPGVARSYLFSSFRAN